MGKRRNKRHKTNKFRQAINHVKKNINKKETAITVVNNTKTTNTSGSYYLYKKNYDYKGRRNKTDYTGFTSLCMFKQEHLKYFLEAKLKYAGYENIIWGDGYLYAKGDIPILLTAHMDTVHKDIVRDFYEYYDEEKKQHIISSPQGIGGDDRCGIYMILEIIKTHKCSVLFCEDEEIGCVGSHAFSETEHIKELSELKYLIELDRMNGNDAVFYDCMNPEFTDFIIDNTGYEESWGSCSDISVLSPACGVASVNLSCGYYNAHSTSEYVIMEEMFNTIEVVKKLLDVECEQFEFIELEDNYGYGCYNTWSSYNKGTYKKTIDVSNIKTSDVKKDLSLAKKKELAYGYSEEISVLISIYDYENGDTLEYVYNGKSADEAFGRFFRENPTYSYNDVFDYSICDSVIWEEGLINSY